MTPLLHLPVPPAQGGLLRRFLPAGEPGRLGKFPGHFQQRIPADSPGIGDNRGWAAGGGDCAGEEEEKGAVERQRAGIIPAFFDWAK